MVDVDDATVYILWTVLFIEYQGWNIVMSILYKEKRIAIILEANGKSSSGKGIQVLNICYNLMKYQVEKETLQIKNCPTDEMWGNLITNPMQGPTFRNYLFGGNKKSVHGKK